MPEEIFKIISFLTVFQILVFIIYLSRKKSLDQSSRFYLVLFLFSILMCLVDRLQYYYRETLFEYKFPHFYNLIDVFSLIYLPALFYYLISITKDGFKLKWIQVLDFIPAAIIFTNLFLNYYIHPADVKYELLQDNAPFEFVVWNIDIPALLNLLQTGYLIVGLLVIFKYERAVKVQYATINDQLIQLLKITFLVFLALRIGRWLLTILASELFLPIDFDLAIYAILIMVFGFRNSTSFLVRVKEINKDSSKASQSGLKEKLEMCMVVAKPHLNPDISLRQLAVLLEISERELSQFLNSDLKLNFFNFINQYRIDEAKKQLQNPELGSKTILEILYDVGFNNKSAFNREFKRITGTTPSDFRNLKK